MVTQLAAKEAEPCVDREIAVDPAQRRLLAGRLRRKHRYWPIARLFQILLWAAYPVACYMFYQWIGDRMSAGSNISQVMDLMLLVMGFGLGSITVGLLAALYHAILRQCIAGEVTEKQAERLVAAPDALINTYHPRYIGSWPLFVETTVYFREIRRIEVNTYHEMVKVWAPVHIRHFLGRSRDVSEKDGVISEECKAYRNYYLYYKDNEALVDILKVRSGVPVLTVDTPDSQIKEARL